MGNSTTVFDAFVVKGKSAAAVVSFAQPAHHDQSSTAKKKADDNKYDWVRWYSPDNNQPNILLNYVLGNNLLPGILQTKIDFLVGSGLVVYRSSVIDGKLVPTIDTAHPANEMLEDLHAELIKCATDYSYFGNYFCEYVRSEDLKNVLSMKHQDAFYVRTGKKGSNGMVKEYFVSSNWTEKTQKKGVTYSVVPGYIPGKVERKFIFHGKRYVPGHPYYSPPEWIGIVENVKLANQIPAFHANALTNGYNIKYHIKVPVSYFDDCNGDVEKIAIKKASLQSQLEEFLGGTPNAMKSFVSFVKNIPGTSIADGWVIEPVTNNMNDEAYSKLFEMTNTAIISGNSIDPTLCGIQTQGKLSSGSEHRNAYLIHLALKTPRPRLILLQSLDIIRKINGWEDIVFGFKDIEITTLDKNPTGSQTVAVQ